MKKIVALLLAAVLVLGLAACAAKAPAEAPAPAAEKPAETSAPAEEKPAEVPAKEEAPAALPYEGVNLKFWVAPFIRDDTDKSFWDEKLQGFTAETGAKVEVEVVGWADMATKYLTGFMSNAAADVLYTTNEILYDFISQGCLLDVTPYWSADDIANENFWDATDSNGKHFAVPFVGGTGYRVYIYNMDVLNECGVTEMPKTWDELLDVCEAVKTGRPDIYPFLTPMAGNNNAFLTNFLQFLMQSGGSMLNASGDAYAINSPEGLEAMNFIKTLVDKGYLSTDCLGLEDSNVRDLFAEGKIAVSVIDCPNQYMTDAQFNWACSTELTNKTSASFCPVDTLAVNASSANVDAAVALLKYIRSSAVMEDFVKEIYETGQVAKDYPDIGVDEHMVDVYAHSERAYVLPVAPNIQLVIDSIMTNQQLVVMGTLTPEQALEQIQAEADKAFG